MANVVDAFINLSQLSLFTICVWLHKKKRSMVYVDDHLEYDKTTVLVSLNKLLGDFTAPMELRK